MSRHPVDFFIVGVQKGGTTALDWMLRAHAHILMARMKETHFFDNDSLDWAAPDYTPFESLFDAAGNKARGEATPIYLFWPGALERIKRYNPDAKIIVCLRHPVHRAYSHWRMATKQHGETLSFAKAIREGRDRIVSPNCVAARLFSYVERGFYAGQIRRLLGLFEDTLFLKTGDLWAEPEAEYAKVLRLIGVPYAPPPERRYKVPVDTSKMPPLPLAEWRYLQDLYREDIAETASLTGLDLSDWQSTDYREGLGMGPSG